MNDAEVVQRGNAAAKLDEKFHDARRFPTESKQPESIAVCHVLFNDSKSVRRHCDDARRMSDGASV